MEKKTMFFELTKSKMPAIWERGGHLEDTGAAIVVAADDGSRKKAIHITNKPNGRHALIPIRQNDIIVTVKVILNSVYSISIYRIQIIDFERRKANLLKIANCQKNQWDDPIVANAYSVVVEKAKKLAFTKSCCEPVYCRFTKI